MATTNNNNKEKREKTRPLLFLLGELSGETKHGFFDPLSHEVREVDIPELSHQIHCLSSGFGWLLLISREASSLYFFNPLTSQKINVPYRSACFNGAVFTAPPTSNNCTLYAIENNPLVGLRIDAIHVGNNESWTRYRYNLDRKKFDAITQAVVKDNVLFCVDLYGRVVTFDVKSGQWRNPTLYKGFKPVKVSYVLEHGGEIFSSKSNTAKYGGVYKMKIEDGLISWKELKNMGDLTLCFGFGASCGFSGLTEDLQKKIFVAKENPSSKCVTRGGEPSDDFVSSAGSSFGWSYVPIWIEAPSKYY